MPRLLALLLAAGCAHAPPPAPTQAPGIHVAALLSLTGVNAGFGLSVLDGARLAEAEVNANGGLLGSPLTLDVVDDQGDAAWAGQEAARLGADPSVLALIGEVTSGLSLRVAQEAQRAGLPMVTPSATNPAVTEVGDFIFRACFIDPNQGQAMAHYAWETLGVRRAGMLVDESSSYSRSLAESFEAAFTASGGEVSRQVYRGGDADFGAQLSALTEANPEVLYLPGYYPDVARIAAATRSAGLQTPLLGGDGWESSELLLLGQESVLNGLFTTHFAPDDPNPATRAFAAHFEQRYARPPDALAALGYDAVELIAAAIRSAGAADRESIQRALAKVVAFPGLSGPLTVGADHNPQKPAVILRVTPTGFAYEATVGPF